MKNLIAFLFFLVSAFNGFSQSTPDTIITKSKDKIVCKILDLDPKEQAIIYSIPGNDNVNFIPISEVYQYFMDGELYLAVGKISVWDKRNRINSEDDIYVRKEYVNPTYTSEYNGNLSTLQRAGNELVKFADMAQIGISLQIAGGIFVGFGSMMDADDSAKDFLLIAGTGAAAVGFIIHSMSFSKARKAGKLLRVSTSQDGIGVAIPIN